MKVLGWEITRSKPAVVSGGGAAYAPDPAWMTSYLGPGQPIQPITPAKETEVPRTIDYPISVNAQLTPRSGFGLMPFSQLMMAYEKVPECRFPVNLIHRQLSSYQPRLIDKRGNAIQGHPYQWMCEYPDGKTPYSVWLTRYLKSAKIYDAPALYFERGHSGIEGLHFIDGSTLFVILDERGNTPMPERPEDYILRMATQRLQNPVPVPGAARGPNSIDEFINQYNQRFIDGDDVPVKMPAYTQVIKGTPYAWWSSDDIWYMPESRRVNSPYGEPFIEAAWPWIMIIVNLTAFELAHYRTGNMPEGYVTLPKDWLMTPDQLEALELAFNERMTRNPVTERNRIRIFPEGSQWFQTKRGEWPESLYNRARGNILDQIGIPPAEAGDIPGKGLGGKGFKEGASVELNRNTINPNRNTLLTPFNYVLALQGVDDVVMTLEPPIGEIDPDKLKDSVYNGMAHGTYSLNDGRSLLNMAPIGDPNDPNNIANKHLIVAGSAIYVIEEMEISQGMAVPAFGGKAEKPAGPETAMGEPEHTPEDEQTINRLMSQAAETGTITSTHYSIPKSVEKLRKADVTHSTGSMVAAFIPEEVAEELSAIARNINWTRDVQFEKPENMHITLAYFDKGVPADKKAQFVELLKGCCEEGNVLECKVQGFGVFNAPEGKVLYASVDCLGLSDFRSSLCDAIERFGVPYSKEHDFIAHITLAYLPDKYLLQEGFAVPDIEFEIDSLDYAVGPQRTALPLGYPLDKHCGVCDEDDLYAGAPLSRAATVVFPQKDHANGVEIVAMAPEGLPVKAALWKPEGSEDEGLRSWIGGPQYLREEAAYRLDRALKFYLVPVAYVTQDNDEAGAAVYYTPAAKPARKPEEYDEEWIEKAAVLDYIAGQKDRGYKHNYLTHPDESGRPILFDNGLSFPPGIMENGYSPFIGLTKEISPAVRASIVECLKDWDAWARIADLVGTGPVNGARARATALLNAGWDGSLQKFNSKHDDEGRFASGPGGNGGKNASAPKMEEDKPKQQEKPRAKKGEMHNVGGSYRRVSEKAQPGEEIHHMPAAESSPLHALNGPAIALPKADHIQTASYGTSRAAREYRAKQRKLISEGKFREAQQMDIDDLKAKFGNKYDKHIAELQAYTDTIKFRKNIGIPMNPTPKAIRRGDA